MKKVIFIDMDGTIVDFHGAIDRDIVHGELVPESLEKGFYRNLKPIEGAIEAVKKLCEHFDVYIASKPKKENPHCLEEKMEWIREYLPELKKKVFFTPNKCLLAGDVLIDDDLRWKDFKGNFIHFDSFNPNWSYICTNLIKEQLK